MLIFRFLAPCCTFFRFPSREKKDPGLPTSLFHNFLLFGFFISVGHWRYEAKRFTNNSFCTAEFHRSLPLREDAQAPPAILEMDKNVVRVFRDRLEVPTLVDTGAVVSVMSERLRKRLKNVATPCDANLLRGVVNNVLCLLGLCNARVQVSEYVLAVTFVILSLCSHDLILGLDFLREHGALISSRTGELAICPFPAADYWNGAEPQNMSGNLSVRSTTTIPPSTGVWLAVKSSKSERTLASVDILTEIKRNVLLQKSVATPTSLVTLKHIEAFVWVVSFSYQAAVITAGLVVASFSVVPSF